MPIASPCHEHDAIDLWAGKVTVNGMNLRLISIGFITGNLVNRSRILFVLFLFVCLFVWFVSNEVYQHYRSLGTTS